MASVQADIVDKGGILESETRNSADKFSERTGYALSIVIEDYMENPEEYAIKQYNKNEQDILLLYTIKNKSTVIVQPGEDILANEQLKSIGSSHEEERDAISDNRGINKYITNIISSLEEEITGEKAEETAPSLSFPVGKKTKKSCSLIKDGFCDPDCPDDPDCECGDGICQEHESSATCPEDCGEEMDITCGVIRDEVCDLECPVRDIDCKVSPAIDLILSSSDEDSPMFNIIVGILIASMIVCAVIALLLLRSIRRQQW